MKRSSLVVSVAFISLLGIGSAGHRVAAQVTAYSEATLYSSIKYHGERLRKCVSFRGPSQPGKVDLCYGSLYVGKLHDWFDTEDPDRRTVVKDLGLRNWSDRFAVPVLRPLAELKPGQHRQVAVDASGRKHGRVGEPGADGVSGNAGSADFRSEKEPGEIPGPALAIPEASRPQRRNDSKPKVDRFYTKAVLGHLYVIHVVDEGADFYALFRVDELESGGRCTISWRVIPNQVPPDKATLYSVLKYGDEQHKNCLNLATGALGAANRMRQQCNLYYGLMSSKDDLDWFRTAAVDGDRSVIKDLGELAWTSRFEVPAIASLTKLATGEHRQITVDFSGNSGAATQTGRSPASSRAEETLAENSSVYAFMRPGDDNFVPRPYTRKKYEAGPQTDPRFIIAKVSPGHMYVVHAVDDSKDFYALIHVDAVERGDHCTISWRLIPAPEPEATRKK